MSYSMDRRRQVRHPSGQRARVTLLGDHPVELKAEVENLSPAGARLLLERSLPLSAPVKVELRESVLLGEVCYVQPEQGRFAVGLAVDQVLRRTPELARLVRALGGRMPAPDTGPEAGGPTTAPRATPAGKEPGPPAR